MAGSGVALRLHEFRETQDSRQLDGPTTLTPIPSRLGRDIYGLYPGQLGRVHIVHSKNHGYNVRGGRSQSHHESRLSPYPPCEDYQLSFDVQTLRALTVLRHSPAILDQRPPQTTYQEQFGLQSPLFPQ